MAGTSPCPACAQARRLHALLSADDVDAAIEAGLMAFAPCACESSRTETEAVLEAQARLRAAWAARERHHARDERLARRAAERDARRKAPAAPTASPVPSLPPAAAEILARAKAKAAERMKR